jgi:hypothetical protein
MWPDTNPGTKFPCRNCQGRHGVAIVFKFGRCILHFKCFEWHIFVPQSFGGNFGGKWINHGAVDDAAAAAKGTITASCLSSLAVSTIMLLLTAVPAGAVVGLSKKPMSSKLISTGKATATGGVAAEGGGGAVAGGAGAAALGGGGGAPGTLPPNKAAVMRSFSIPEFFQ